MGNEITRLRVLAEIRRVSFPIIVSEEYSASWWGCSFGMRIIDSQADAMCDLLEKVESIFEELE